MKKFVLIAAVATLSVSAVSAEARDRWRERQLQVWQDRPVYFFDEEEEDVGYYEAEDDDVVVPLRRRDRAQQMRDAEDQIDAELWWLDNDARRKLEQRQKARKPVVKKATAKVAPAPKPRPKAVVATAVKPKPVKQLQTASLSKPDVLVKPKSKPVVEKTIGCTAGAAVVTGYGFGDVKPKVCTGKTYAYSAARSGKAYEIKLTAVSGEIIDVKKLN